MSTDSSVGTYDSLFDDDTVALRASCFNLDGAQLDDPASNGRMHEPSLYCLSSSSSCCSLCRPPAMSEADEDSNTYRPAKEATFRPGPYQGKEKSRVASLTRGTVNRHKPSSISLHDCNGSSKMLSPCRSLLRVPIESIAIPLSYTVQSASAKVDEKAIPINCNHRLLTSFLPDDALCHVARCLDVTSLLRLRECSRKLRHAASHNNAGWQHHTTSLWSSKVTVCRAARKLLAESNRTRTESAAARAYATCAAMEAYKVSFTDAASRQEITPEELCFDGPPGAAGASWTFRFKESWTSWDPSWTRQDVRRLVFLRDGTILQAHPRGAGVYARNCNGTRLYDVFSEGSARRDGVALPVLNIEMKWRFVRRPLDLPHRPPGDRPPGAYVRVTVGGLDVPTYVVRRAPNGDWGFLLESCRGVYAAVGQAPRAQSAVGWGPGLPYERRSGSRWRGECEGREEGGEESGPWRSRNVRRRLAPSNAGSFAIEDGSSQWREALLYNIGTLSLPDGNIASEFDHAWRNFMTIK